MLKRLWMDEGGALLSAELVFVMTLLICAIAVGVSAIRTALVSELADTAAAIAVVDQSYSIGGITGHHAKCNGWMWQDAVDSCDDGQTQPTGLQSRCVRVCLTPTTGETGAAFIDPGI